MKTIVKLLLMILLVVSCKEKNRNNVELNTQEGEHCYTCFSNLIDSLFVIDQKIQVDISQASKQGDAKTIKELIIKQNIIFDRHISVLNDIYDKIGYPTIHRVGRKSSSKFFTLVQHSDSDLNFQKKMLIEIKKEVQKGNVSGKNYAFLVDRV